MKDREVVNQKMKKAKNAATRGAQHPEGEIPQARGTDFKPVQNTEA